MKSVTLLENICIKNSNHMYLFHHIVDVHFMSFFKVTDITIILTKDMSQSFICLYTKSSHIGEYIEHIYQMSVGLILKLMNEMNKSIYLREPLLR